MKGIVVIRRSSLNPNQKLEGDDYVCRLFGSREDWRDRRRGAYVFIIHRYANQ